MDIIKITPATIGGEAVQTVNARESHGFLGVAKQFSDWLPVQFARARLIEGRDYMSEVAPLQGYNPRGGRRIEIDYHLTIDAAKHIAMLSGTEKGFEVREYFIECERRAKAKADPIALLNDPAHLRSLLLSYSERTQELEARVEQMAPKVAVVEQHMAVGDGGTREGATAAH